VPADDLHERFCSFCLLAATRENLVMVIDEGQLFTRPGGAPPEWSYCTLQGRHHGIRIFLQSQRPTHTDKDFFTNATFLRSGRLNFADDITTMANALRVPIPAVRSLLGFEWIGRDLLTGDLSCEPADAVSRGQAPAAPVAAIPAAAAPGGGPLRAPKKRKKRKKSARRRASL